MYTWYTSRKCIKSIQSCNLRFNYDLAEIHLQCVNIVSINIRSFGREDLSRAVAITTTISKGYRNY
ncbi:hypothetical protein BH20ACI2_BH20ACI2_23090 [soil metagenome]